MKKLLVGIMIASSFSAFSTILISPYNDEGELVACIEYADLLDAIDLKKINFTANKEVVKSELTQLFLSAAQSISNRVHVSVNHSSGVYKIYESDNQHSAWGGSEHTIFTNQEKNSVTVILDGCWVSGE